MCVDYIFVGVIKEFFYTDKRYLVNTHSPMPRISIKELYFLTYLRTSKDVRNQFCNYQNKVEKLGMSYAKLMKVEVSQVLVWHQKLINKTKFLSVQLGKTLALTIL